MFKIKFKENYWKTFNFWGNKVMALLTLLKFGYFFVVFEYAHSKLVFIRTHEFSLPRRVVSCRKSRDRTEYQVENVF